MLFYFGEIALKPGIEYYKYIDKAYDTLIGRINSIEKIVLTLCQEDEMDEWAIEVAEELRRLSDG